MTDTTPQLAGQSANQPHLQVTAAVFVQRESVLAVRRAGDQHMAGYWEFPGGKVERDETLQQCLTREIAEELGTSITVGEYLGQSDFSAADSSLSLHAFLVTEWTGEITLSVHDELRWLSAGALQSVNWAPADRPFLPRVGQLLKERSNSKPV